MARCAVKAKNGSTIHPGLEPENVLVDKNTIESMSEAIASGKLGAQIQLETKAVPVSGNNPEELKANAIKELQKAGIPEQIAKQIAEQMERKFKRDRFINALDKMMRRAAIHAAFPSETAATLIDKIVDNPGKGIKSKAEAKAMLEAMIGQYGEKIRAAHKKIIDELFEGKTIEELL